MNEKQKNPKIDINKVKKVYSGINGRCCCGCSGKYSYASKDGLSDLKEVNDRTVKMITNKINCLADDSSFEINETYASVVVGNRLYIAYFVENK